MDCSVPGFPVLHYLLEFAQTRVYRFSGATQPFHPLSPPSPAFNLSQHQGLFQWVGSSQQVAKVLELQHQLLTQCSFLLKLFQCRIISLQDCEGFCHTSCTVDLLRSSVCSWISLGGLYVSRNLSSSSRLFILLYNCSYEFLTTFCLWCQM